LENKHIDLNERDRMIDCLLDWVDPDDLVRLNGAEAEGNYRPANAPLTRIDELKKVKGWEQFTAEPGWDGDFTLNSAGPVDVTWASREVLLALPGMSEAQVDRFLQQRRGLDKIDATADDAKFANLEEVRAALGFTPDQFKILGPLLSLNDPTFHVVSIGKSGNVTRTVQMIVRKTGNYPQIIMWKEL
jgi:general secretion pathway protein K